MKNRLTIAVASLALTLLLASCSSADDASSADAASSGVPVELMPQPLESDSAEPTGKHGMTVATDIAGHERYSGNWDDLIEAGTTDKESEKLIASWRTKKADDAAHAYLQDKWPDFYGTADEAPYWTNLAAYSCQYLYEGYATYSIDKDISDAEDGIVSPTLSLMSIYCGATLDEYLASNDKADIWKHKNIKAPANKL